MELDLFGRRQDDPLPEYARRLRSLRPICAALMGAVVLFGVLSWVLGRGAGGAVPGVPPPEVPLVLSLLAAMLILISSRFRWSILRRALPRTPELPTNPEAVLAAYRNATLFSFAILELAALLGLVVALTSESATYGVVLCLVSALAMLTRWPRATEVDRLVRGRLR